MENNIKPKIPSHEERFKINASDLANLIKELILDCKDEGITDINPMLVDLASEFIKAYDDKKLISSFIEKSKDYWIQIYNRDETFFYENVSSVFGELPLNQINAFKILFNNNQKNNVITDEDKEDIWSYFDSFIKISIKYIHDVRCPTIVYKDNKMKKVYKNKIFPSIPLSKYAKLWNIELLWEENKI